MCREGDFVGIPGEKVCVVGEITPDKFHSCPEVQQKLERGELGLGGPPEGPCEWHIGGMHMRPGVGSPTSCPPLVGVVFFHQISQFEGSILGVVLCFLVSLSFYPNNWCILLCEHSLRKPTNLSGKLPSSP